MRIVKNSKKRGKKDKLTPRNRKFIDNYINSGVQTRAYIEAGYSENGAEQSASKLLTNPFIIVQIEKRRLEIAEANNITAAKIINEQAKIAFLTSDDVFTFSKVKIKTKDSPLGIYQGVVILRPHSELSEAALASISSIKETQNGIEIKLYDKQKSLDALAKYVGLNNEAEITRAKEIKYNEQSQEIVDPLEGMTVEEIEEEIKKIA